MGLGPTGTCAEASRGQSAEATCEAAGRAQCLQPAGNQVTMPFRPLRGLASAAAGRSQRAAVRGSTPESRAAAQAPRARARCCSPFGPWRPRRTRLRAHERKGGQGRRRRAGIVGRGVGWGGNGVQGVTGSAGSLCAAALERRQCATTVGAADAFQARRGRGAATALAAQARCAVPNVAART